MNWRLIKLGALLLLSLVVLSSCGFPGVESTSAQLPQVSATQQTTANLPPVRFPQDEGAHNNLTEWWYYTGHLNAIDATGQPHRYGFELVAFQSLRSDFPPLYSAHFAISDITRGEFHYDQRSLLVPNAVTDGKSTKGIDVHVADWSIQGLNGRDHLIAQMSNYVANLQLEGRKAPTLHNGTGLITYGLAGYSYYYSRTRMAVSGVLVDHNQPVQVSGEAWMDHQWGNFLTLAGSGWDWFSMQLNNNTEIMLYFIRDNQGRTAATYVGYIDEKGADHIISDKSLRVTVLDKWTSPQTGATYPSGWRIEITDPQLSTTLTILPSLKDQELVVLKSTGNIYWEGAVSIQGQRNGNPLAGDGYVELTGYGKP